MSDTLTSSTSAPDGYRVLFAACEPTGIVDAKRNALRFITGKDRRLALVPEPTRRGDPDAVKVVGSISGLFGRKHMHLGYLHPVVSSAIKELGGTDYVLPRLRYVGFDHEWVCVEFAILTRVAA